MHAHTHTHTTTHIHKHTLHIYTRHVYFFLSLSHFSLSLSISDACRRDAYGLTSTASRMHLSGATVSAHSAPESSGSAATHSHRWQALSKISQEFHRFSKILDPSTGVVMKLQGRSLPLIARRWVWIVISWASECLQNLGEACRQTSESPWNRAEVWNANRHCWSLFL